MKRSTKRARGEGSSSVIESKKRFRGNDTALAEDDAALGKALIRALTCFMIPLIQKDKTAQEFSTPLSKSACGPSSGLTTEGQNLLTALQQFAGSLSYSVNNQQSGQQSTKFLDQLSAVPQSHNLPENKRNKLFDVQLATSQDSQLHKSNLVGVTSYMDKQRKDKMEKMLNKAHERVFNEMPIRLLTFNQDGNGITFIHKSQLMEHIYTDITSYQGDLNKYKHPFEKYAILSHTWLPNGEVTYSQWTAHPTSLNTQSPGYKKLSQFCKVAASYGLHLAWMDTVCINKDSSSELDESIRSMFKWYNKAEVCIAYLEETMTVDNMEDDKWFTRGWTLQELLAPKYIKFYAKNWALLFANQHTSDKSEYSDLQQRICKATGLNNKELSESPKFNQVPIWRKMQWAANRNVTREEDTAYSLMGIFNISMPTGYGEGAEHAFMRLVKEIFNSQLTSVSKLEIINWSPEAALNLEKTHDFLSPPISSSKLIPRSPHAYKYSSSSNNNIQFHPSSAPITLSYMGLCIPVLLLPVRVVWRGHNNNFQPKGDFSAECDYSHIIRGTTCNILDAALFSSEDSLMSVFLIGVLNIADTDTEILLPENDQCLAIQLYHSKPLNGWEITADIQFTMPVKRYLTFQMVYHNYASFRIPKTELNRHGMTFRTMHL